MHQPAGLYGSKVGRRTVSARSNCSRMEVCRSCMYKSQSVRVGWRCGGSSVQLALLRAGRHYRRLLHAQSSPRRAQRVSRSVFEQDRLFLSQRHLSAGRVSPYWLFTLPTLSAWQKFLSSDMSGPCVRSDFKDLSPRNRRLWTPPNAIGMFQLLVTPTLFTNGLISCLISACLTKALLYPIQWHGKCARSQRTFFQCHSI